MDGCSNLNKKNQSFQDYEDSNSLWILILEFLELISRARFSRNRIYRSISRRITDYLLQDFLRIIKRFPRNIGDLDPFVIAIIVTICIKFDFENPSLSSNIIDIRFEENQSRLTNIRLRSNTNSQHRWRDVAAWKRLEKIASSFNLINDFHNRIGR